METQKNNKIARLARFKNGDHAIKIIFPFDFEIIKKIKTIPGRKYHAVDNSKFWTSPISADAIKLLQELDFIFNTTLTTFITEKNLLKDNIKPKFKLIEVKGLKKKLFPFQKYGVSFIEHKNGKTLLADEMGLGKTVQALAYLQHHPELRPAIIVCPASLKLNWEKEAYDWMPNPDCKVVSGTNTDETLFQGIIILNYDIVPKWLEKLVNLKAKVLITDECHYYKNNKAQRTKAIKKLSKTIPHHIALSGTPIVNRPIEIFNAINLIDRYLMPSFWSFVHKYCGAKNNGFGWDFSGASNTKELHEKLINSIMLRRKKSDVLKELPDKIRSFIPIEPDNIKEYKSAENDFIGFLQKTKGKEAAAKAGNAETLVRIEALKQLAVEGKLEETINWVRDFLDTGEKLVLFAVHKTVVNALMTRFPNVAVKIDGSVSTVNRQKAVDEFQTNDKIRLFVGNIKAAGVGITLTAASNVVFLELPWTPGELVQAEDRTHRIGQKNAVNIYYLLALNTIEEKIANLLDEKRKVLDEILDGKTTLRSSLLGELIKSYK